MTPEREREIRSAVEEADPPYWLDRAAIDLLAEIDRLRALPVIATCEDCAHLRRYVGMPDYCAHTSTVGRDTDADAAPPEWYPLRGGR